ncbi:hypothetical protein [Primorskyibacter sp. 2E233]|uniref:hypothetical protein n=1 Tax=Primorskyibacter sp. 2E233 TaxID=3413431 RepID=UPI003BF0E374
MAGFGNILGIRASLMLGKGPVIAPAPLNAMEAILEIEVRQSTLRPSGFKLVLAAGREGPLGLWGPPFVEDPRFQKGARAVLTVWNGIKPTPIFDGIVTETQYLPGTENNEGRYILLGHDLTWLMNLEDKREEHPMQDETAIALKIAGQYAQYGIIPTVIPPTVIDPPIAVQRTPQQCCTDLGYLKKMAKRHGYKVFIDPGPAPGGSILYFGPVPLPGAPQKPISVNLGPMSDAFDVQVNHNGARFTAARAKVQDSATGQVTELQMPTATTLPNSAMPDSQSLTSEIREKRIATSGMNVAQVMARLMALVNDSAEATVKVSGTIDNTRYNAVLKPYRWVQIRGLGMVYNGIYVVAEVRHLLRPGDYRQTFVLHGDGVYPMVPLVTPEVA